MSIIYDALKKVESSRRPDKINNPLKKKSVIRKYLLYLFIAVLGFLTANISLKMLGAEKRSAQPTPLSYPAQSQDIAPIQNLPNEEKPHLEYFLNGIFVTEDESYAIINNKIVKEGDRLNEATVLRINPDSVELKTADFYFNLTRSE
jgi:hypothetical protein